MKKLSSIIVMAILVLSVIPAAVFGESDETDPQGSTEDVAQRAPTGIYYREKDSETGIYGRGDGSFGKVQGARSSGGLVQAKQVRVYPSDEQGIAVGQRMKVLRSQQDGVRAIKGQIKDCVKNDQTGAKDCAQPFAQFQTYLSALADRLEELANNALARIEKSDKDFSDEKATLEAALAKVNEAQEILSKDVLEREDIVEAAALLRKGPLQDIKKTINKIKKTKVNNRMKNIPGRVEKVIERLEKLKEKVGEEKQAEIDEAIAKLTQLLEEARTHIDENDYDSAKKIVKDIHQDIKELVASLRENRKAVRSVASDGTEE